MAQKGEAGKAIGISMMSSFVGGFVGLAGLIFLSPLVAKFVFTFKPPEYFMLALLGLVLISASAKDGMAKALIAGVFGALASSVGLDIMTGQPRFNFGNEYLVGGIPFIPLIIGIFAFAEVISLLAKGQSTIAEKGKLTGSIIDGLLVPFKYLKTLIRSTLIGFGIGVIPGEGAAVANITCYLIEAKASKRSEKFGTGIPEGVIAPEASNNACVSGALIPTLTLGIPGGGVAAIFMGGIMVHGINPGPELYSSHLDILYTLFFGLICANILLFICGVSLSRYIAKITVIPISILAPCIIILGVVSTYLMRNNFVDVFIAILAGFVGYCMRKYGYSPVAFLVAFILSPIAESNFYQSLMIADDSYLTFITRPFSAGLLAIILGLIFVPPIMRRLKGGS
jgi:putative tricarboxylic transport membrane protein